MLKGCKIFIPLLFIVHSSIEGAEEQSPWSVEQGLRLHVTSKDSTYFVNYFALSTGQYGTMQDSTE
jgi:hypothetical protein